MHSMLVVEMKTFVVNRSLDTIMTRDRASKLRMPN
jgi:hypothetical protein